jgi:hypothetical protein
LNLILQKITGVTLLFRNIKSITHNDYEVMVFDLVKQKIYRITSINETNVSFPMIYTIKYRIMDAGYKITDAIRTNISFLKVKRLIHKTKLNE